MPNVSLRLSEDAVQSRPSASHQISMESLSALRAGDTTALLASYRDRFGGFSMKLKDDEDDTEDDDEDEEGDDDDDDEDDSDDEDSEDDDDDDADGPEGKKSKKGSKKDDSPEGLKSRIAALEDEKNRLHRGRQRARQERDDLQQEIDRLKKDGVSDDSVKAENKELSKSNEKLADDLRSARLMIAFLSDDMQEWHDPSVALRAADLSDLEIDDDGTVHGMKSVIASLVESKPFLLKSTKTGTTRKRNPPTRQSSGSSTKKKGTSAARQQAERERIKNKFSINR